jgi:hypothetical protein
MSTNAGIGSDALKYVTQKTETIQQLDERLEEKETEEETTTSDIF